MSILMSNEIINAVKEELQSATSSVQIITAYCKENSFKYLNECICPAVMDKKLLVRFRLDDIIKGSTDFSILKFGIEAGWKVYIRFDLHAKTYIVDNKRGLIGSVNATNAGLGIGKVGNMEMASLIDIEPQDISKVEKLFSDAICVDDSLIERFRKQLEHIENGNNIESHSWDTSTTALFKPHIDTLFSYELPDEMSIIEGSYYPFIEQKFDGDREKFKETFRWSNVYLWLLATLQESGGCMFFGELSQKLHEVVIADPMPYRKDVKQMLANLLSLIEELKMPEVIIDRPNYSQRIRLKE